MSGIGLPDWYNIKKAGAISALGDLGELAVRLGSIVSFDRRGDVVFMDSFEEGLLKWNVLGIGTGAAAALSRDQARSGGYSVKLTAGSDSTCQVILYHDVPYPVLGRMGLECSFAFDADLSDLQLWLQLYDGVTRYDPCVRYDFVNQVLQYRAEDLAWTDLVTGLYLYLEGFPFWTWKLVADFEAGEYVRLIMNNVEYDLEGIPFYTVANTGTVRVVPVIKNVTVLGSNGVVHVDDVIITQNEP